MRNPIAKLSHRVRVFIATAVGLLAAYATFGFFIAPGIVRRNLVSQVGGTLHRPVAVGRVAVNPFALSVTVDSLRVSDLDGAPLFAWDEFYINFEIISIVKREFHFAEIRLLRPYARLVMRRDGTLNVSDIVDSINAAPKSATAGPAPVVAVSGLHIDGARVDVLDSATARPFATTLGPLRIDLASFATRRDNNSQYSFSGRTEIGETFAWAGTFAIDPIRSAGEFSLDSIRSGKYGPFYERNVSFDVVEGRWGVKAKYQVDLTPRARVIRVFEGTAHLDKLALVERGRTDTALSVARLDVRGAEADAESHFARVASITTSGGVVRVERARGGTINLLRMLNAPRDTTAPAPAPPPKGLAPAAPAAPPPKSAPWRWSIARLAVDSYTVTVLDSSTLRPARLSLAAVTLGIDSVASDSNARTRVHASLRWEQRGTLTADGAISIWRRQGELALAAKDLSLGPLDPYLAPRANLLISDGRLASDMHIRFDLADTLKPDLGLKGSVQVDRFATVDGTRREPFFGFRAFRVASIDYGLRARRLSIQSITLDRPVLDVGVASDGKPITRVVFPDAAADSADVAAMAADSLHADSAARDSVAPAPARPAAPAPAAKAAKRAPPPPAAPAMRASVGSIKVTDGVIRVVDRSIQPPVALTVTKLNAATGRLSTDSIGVGSLDLTAMVDEVAPLKISGRFNPLSDKEGSDLVVELQGMELVPVGPYSGKYLGYLIATGKMKVAMQYRVVGRRLKSENKLTLDAFEFGDKTSSPDATSMPVKLAFSVMRDRDGQIVFDVPVEGNLDDPSFRLGRVIGRAIMNVLTKLLTSPFKLLGSAFGGGSADLSYVQFAAGSDTLSSAEAKKLDVLAKSLYERPALKLEIAGAVDTLADRAALRRAKLDAQLRTRKWTALKARDANAPPPDSIRLTEADRAALLAAVFAGAFPTDSAVLAAKQSKAPLPYTPAEMEERLLGTIPIQAEDLQFLAAARAKRCLDYLLTVPANKVEPERVLLTGGGIKKDGARAEFSLQ